jgi:hypothetical protein
MTHPSPEVIARLHDAYILGSIDQLVAQIEDGSAARGYARLCQEAYDRDCAYLRARAEELAHIVIVTQAEEAA